MLWVMLPVCSALAYAIELSLATFSASAALIGAATLALTSDIAARSGSGSTDSGSSSLGVRSVMVVIRGQLLCRGLDALDDRGGLLGAGGGEGAVRQHVRGEREIDRDREVRVDERHRGAVGQRLDLLHLELVQGELGGGLVLDLHRSSFVPDGTSVTLDETMMSHPW